MANCAPLVSYGHLSLGGAQTPPQATVHPIDSASRTGDQWAQCTQGKGTVRAYIDRFHWALLHVQDAVPTEVLDYFIQDSAPFVNAQVLV